MHLAELWTAGQDSNLCALDSDPSALPLSYRQIEMFMDMRVGFEPTKDGFAIRRNRPGSAIA